MFRGGGTGKQKLQGDAHMDPTLWVGIINESGLPLAMLLLSLTVNGVMFRIIQKLWDGRLADAKHYIEAGHAQTRAMEAVTSVVKELTQEMKELSRQRNG